MIDVINEIYYDANGNKIKEVDANNTPLPYDEQKAYTYTYSARDKLLTETDLAGNTTSYSYDKADRRVTMTGPRGNSGQYDADFTLVYHYDDLDRLIKGELPRSIGDTEDPVVSLEYDPRGNLLERVEPDGSKSRYTYYPRNLVKTETVVGIDEDGEEKSYTTSYDYDEAGNQSEIIDPEMNTTIKEYDDLNRVIRIIYPEGNEEEITYDERGNKSLFEDGKDNTTDYSYDAYNRLYMVTDAKGNSTEYLYDRMGNLTLKKNRLGHETEYDYDELNRLILEEDSLGNQTEYAYDSVGNRTYKKDPNGTESSYKYYDNYLVKEVTMTNDNQSHSISYSYDEAGFQKEVIDGDVTSRYNYLYDSDTGNYSYTPDPYDRIHRKADIVDGQSFSTEYRYDIMGRVRGIKTPRGEWVEYEYNNIGELTAVPGFVQNTSYNSRGMLESITAVNGLLSNYSYDTNGRLTDLSYNNQSEALKEYSLSYDSANNITSLNNNSYNYDRLNQLVLANLKGRFELESDLEHQDINAGRAVDDYQGQEELEEVENTEIIELDYAAGSIGLNLGGTFPVTRIELTAESPVHRVEEKDLTVYSSTNGYQYTEINDFEIRKDEEGKLWILLDQEVEARYIKVKSYFDERDEDFNPVNQAEFVNSAEDIIRVFYYVTNRIEDYDYDAGGNRTKSSISMRNTESTTYSYYSNSNRLKSNGRYAYIYDDNGNLMEKGTDYTISGDSVTIDPEGEEYWEYEYDLLDRLISVRKNGVTVANYIYNHKGLRVKKENYDTTAYYVFGINDTILYEQENDSFSEYIYVRGQHFARVDGDLISTETTTYFYHTDHLGSTVLVTNTSAEIVWSSEYTPFGSLTMEEGIFFDKAQKFTGKDLDEDTGLYYYNARWYDAENGRFTSADSYKGELENPQTLNLYIYTMNNPLIYVDPTGNKILAHQDHYKDLDLKNVDLYARNSDSYDGTYLFTNILAQGGPAEAYFRVYGRDSYDENTKILKGIGAQLDISIAAGDFGVEIIQFRENWFGKRTYFDVENPYEVYIYGGANISTSTAQEILIEAGKMLSSNDISFGVVAVFGDKYLKNREDYLKWFKTTSGTFKQVKLSYATDPDGHITSVGLSGAKNPFDISTGMVYYTTPDEIGKSINANLDRFFENNKLGEELKNAIEMYENGEEE